MSSIRISGTVPPKVDDRKSNLGNDQNLEKAENYPTDNLLACAQDASVAIPRYPSRIVQMHVCRTYLYEAVHARDRCVSWPPLEPFRSWRSFGKFRIKRLSGSLPVWDGDPWVVKLGFFFIPLHTTSICVTLLRGLEVIGNCSVCPLGEGMSASLCAGPDLKIDNLFSMSRSFGAWHLDDQVVVREKTRRTQSWSFDRARQLYYSC